jgi:hypothetical protein
MSLFNREIGVLRLSHGGYEYIEATGVEPLPREVTEFVVHPLRIASFKCSYTLNAEQFKIGKGGWTN